MSSPQSAARAFGHDPNAPEPPSELYSTPHWFACRTRARAEKKVEELLVRAGFESYLPVVEQDREWSDRTARVGFPLFPGYIFARFELSRIHEVLSVPAIATVARPNGYPTPVRREELDAVRRMVEGANESGVLPTPADYLAPGDEVVMIDGPFEGLRGILIEAKGSTRIAIRIPALRQASSVHVQRESVRRLGKARTISVA